MTAKVVKPAAPVDHRRGHRKCVWRCVCRKVRHHRFFDDDKFFDHRKFRRDRKCVCVKLCRKVRHHRFFDDDKFFDDRRFRHRFDDRFDDRFDGEFFD
jgi:hypothetical protein